MTRFMVFPHGTWLPINTQLTNMEHLPLIHPLLCSRDFVQKPLRNWIFHPLSYDFLGVRGHCGWVWGPGEDLIQHGFVAGMVEHDLAQKLVFDGADGAWQGMICHSPAPSIGHDIIMWKTKPVAWFGRKRIVYSCQQSFLEKISIFIYIYTFGLKCIVNVSKHSIHAIGYIIYLIFVSEKNIQTKGLLIFVGIISEQKRYQNTHHSNKIPHIQFLVLLQTRAIILSTQTMHYHAQISQNYHVHCLIHPIRLMVQTSYNHQLRLVVYPIIYRLWYIPYGLLDFWTIN